MKETRTAIQVSVPHDVGGLEPERPHGQMLLPLFGLLDIEVPARVRPLHLPKLRLEEIVHSETILVQVIDAVKEVAGDHNALTRMEVHLDQNRGLSWFIEVGGPYGRCP